MALIAFTFALTTSAQSSTDFTMDFTNCWEFAGEGPVPLSAAAPPVPRGYTITGAADGTANIVIRATSYAPAAVNGHDLRPTNLSQIGVDLVSPTVAGTSITTPSST